MSDSDFATACAGPIEAAYGPQDVTLIRMYRSFLGDIPVDVLAAAVARCVCESKWVPRIAEIRAAAADIAHGEWAPLSAGEGWRHAQNALRILHPDLPDSAAKARSAVPDTVWEAMIAAGIRTLADAKPTFAEKAFVEAFRPIAERERRRRLAPPSVVAAVEQHRRMNQLPSAANVAAIGVEK